MSNSVQTSAALLRIIVIAIATIAIGAAFIAVAFLSPGNQSSLLPPLPIFVVELFCVAVLVSLSLGVLKSMKHVSVFQVAFLISTVLTSVVISYFGVGHTWSPFSVIGKTIASFLTLSYPILIVAGAIIALRKYSAKSETIWAVSIALCLLFTVPMFLVSITLACFTGDCL